MEVFAAYAVEGTTKHTKHTKTQAESDVRRMSIATPKDDRTKPSPLLWPARSLPRFSFRVLRVFRGSTELLRLSVTLSSGVLLRVKSGAAVPAGSTVDL